MSATSAGRPGHGQAEPIRLDAVEAQQLLGPLACRAGRVAQDDVEADRPFDRGDIAADLGAMPLERLERVADLFDRPGVVPGVCPLGDGPQRLRSPAAADEDGQVWLDRSGLTQRVPHRVARPVVIDPLAVEQAAHQHDRFVEPAEALARALPEVDAEGLVLALEPRAADAEDGPAARHVVQGRGELGREPRVAERVRADHQAEPHALRERARGRPASSSPRGWAVPTGRRSPAGGPRSRPNPSRRPRRRGRRRGTRASPWIATRAAGRIVSSCRGSSGSVVEVVVDGIDGDAEARPGAASRTGCGRVARPWPGRRRGSDAPSPRCPPGRSAGRR